MSLQAGQIVRMLGGGTLWRVDYVNECRARLTPLAKRHVVLADGREFDAERGSVNVSPNSCVEIITDLDRAKVELELLEAEQELASLRAATNERTAAERALKEAEAELAALRQQAPTVMTRSRGAGWTLIGKAPETKPGSLKAQVIEIVSARPGIAAKEISIPNVTSGAIAACLDRFWKAGVLAKGDNRA